MNRAAVAYFAPVINLYSRIKCDIVAKCAVLAEGDARNRDDIIFLETLPLFFK